MLLSHHTRRRDFITLLCGATTWPLAARGANPSRSSLTKMRGLPFDLTLKPSRRGSEMTEQQARPASADAAPIIEGALTAQRLTLNDGRTLEFAEYGDLNRQPVFEFHG
jgi:hypothetical protein